MKSNNRLRDTLAAASESAQKWRLSSFSFWFGVGRCKFPVWKTALWTPGKMLLPVFLKNFKSQIKIN